MEEKKTMHHKRKIVSIALKFMIAVGSVAGTVGIWNELANNEMIQASAEDTEPVVLDLQPLPTIVPLVIVNISAQTNEINTTTIRDVTVDTTIQSNPPAANINPSIITIPAPQPVTTTQSSKK